MYIGVDYYPEHWPRARWATDARLMRQAGFNVVRLAEFAWVNLEPREGHFDFAWLDEALAVLHKQGISAILGTPTAVMPAWVARAYPECLAVKKDGRRTTWGVRKNNCFTSGTYRMLSQRITAAMGGHFAGAPNVIGWQTDNEFGESTGCFCDTCRVEFQSYLRAKFGTLAEFNRAMGTHFWGHRYGDWAEIQLPDEDARDNPSLLLERKRFNSWLNVRFQHEQVQVLRRLCRRHFVTHNFMGLCPWLDYFDLAGDLDHVSWDNYPVAGTPAVPYAASCAADVMRGLKKKNFWIMEQSAGPAGWGSFGRNPRPGEIRKISYQQLAHGADGLIWFRWRTCTAGREQYWHGLLGHDGRPLRRYREAAQTAGDFHRLAKEIAGTTVQADVAIVYDYDSNWAFDFQPCYDAAKTRDASWWGNNYIQAVRRYYSALFRAGASADVVRKTDDLSKYRVVIAPHLYVLPDAAADGLSRFVRGGGVLLADCRTGVKDATSLCHARTLPGKLSAALGISIEEYEALAPELEYPAQGAGAIEGRFLAIHYADWLTTKGAEALATYDPWHMKSFAAATKNRFGKGWGYYVGTIFREDAFYDSLIADVLATAKVQPLCKPPEGVEISYRQGRGRKLMFVINHTEETKTVAVPAGKTELISGAKVGAELELGAYGVAVVKLR